MDAGGTTPGMGEVERSRKPEPRTNHDYRDIGGRVTPGAVTEENRVECAEIQSIKKDNSVFFVAIFFCFSAH